MSCDPHLALDRRCSVESSADPSNSPAAALLSSPLPPIPDQQSGDLGPAILTELKRIAVALEALCTEGKRIADHVAPEPGDVVGTPYLAKQLGCSVVWAGEMARNGQLPKGCIVPGTGCGKPWKFYRKRIEEWINKR